MRCNSYAVSRSIAFAWQIILYTGAARPDLGPEFRLSVVPRTRYVVVYLPMEDGVEIVLVRHGARDIRRLFE